MSLVVLMAVPALSMAAQAPVNLGTTSSFGVLAGTTITNTGPTTVGGNAGGDIGVAPGSAFSDLGTLTLGGASHLGDAVALQAQSDLTAAYLDAAGRTPFTTIDRELGGATLKPGVYVSAAPFEINGTLVLDAEGDPNAVFIFKSASTLVTGAGSNVSLLNGARPCSVFWQVTSSATLGTNSNFVGHLFALQSIQAQTGATIQGQLLARNGAVTLDSNTITNMLCPIIPVPSPTPTDTPSPTTTGTVTGGELPKTGSPWYNVLFAGVALALIGAVGLKTRKTDE